MNFALALAQNKVPGVKVDASQFADDPQQSARQVLFHDATEQTRQAIGKALADQKGKNPNAPTAALAAGLMHRLTGFSAEVACGCVWSGGEVIAGG